MRRYYYPNQEIQYKNYLISISTGGKAYVVKNGTFERLDSLWFPKTRSLSISLPDGEELRIRQINGRLEVINK